MIPVVDFFSLKSPWLTAVLAVALVGCGGGEPQAGTVPPPTTALPQASPQSVAVGSGPESLLVTRPGVSLRLVAEQERALPGQKIAVGLILRHEPGYHTYWKQPGIVGLPSKVEWRLPSGWTAGELLFPWPERTKMAAWGCWGYEREVCLMAELTPPGSWSPGQTSVEISVAYSGMCCAKTCHPTTETLGLTLPLGQADAGVVRPTAWAPAFQLTRGQQPSALPSEWSLSAQRIAPPEGTTVGGELLLKITWPAGQPVPEDVFLFGLDRFIDSHEPQVVQRMAEGAILLRAKICEQPEEVTRLRGLLYSARGLAGVPQGWSLDLALAPAS